MKDLNELFQIKISSNEMCAEIRYNHDSIEHLDRLTISEKDLDVFLKKNNVLFGIDEVNKNKILTARSPDIFPIVIARGKEQKSGEDGKVINKLDMSTDVDRSEGWDFREVMRIPTVKKGEKLATLIPPTKGENGMTVRGRELPAKPGKPKLIKAGKNVIFNKKDQSFYANAEGQASFREKLIFVDTVYEVFGDISMKTGNIDFVGSVIIRGDVPTGFTIKAAGDIKIFGLVEAATIIAEGSVFVSEGIAGLKTGSIQAGEDVQIGYINQGNVTAGNSIFVENSILHSECTAEENIICQKGNIIGGNLTAGKLIKVKDIGNRMNTYTKLLFNTEKQSEDLMSLEAKKANLNENLNKLQLLQRKLTESKEESVKQKITILKLRNSYNKTKEHLELINEQIASINLQLENNEQACLKVKGIMYPNVVISFGKYERKFSKKHENIHVKLDKNDIVITPN